MPALISTFPLSVWKRRRLPALTARAELRIAQVTHPTSLFENASYFAPVRGSGLEQFSPQAVIGSAEHLRALAEAIEQRELALPYLTHALFALTGSRQIPLSDAIREALWHACGVPIYELLLDPDHIPVASECDAHEGWHIEEGVTFFTVAEQLWFRWRRGRPTCTGLTGFIEDQPCPCGRPGGRIVNVEADFRDPIRGRLSAIA